MVLLRLPKFLSQKSFFFFFAFSLCFIFLILEGHETKQIETRCLLDCWNIFWWKKNGRNKMKVKEEEQLRRTKEIS
jgi:hypothetical protein